MVKISCFFCGKDFIPRVGANKRTKYCSIHCRSKDYYKKYYKHFVWKITRTCRYCEVKFEPAVFNQYYCSDLHHKLAWKKRNRDKDNAWQRKRWRELHPITKINKICLYCKEEFITDTKHKYQKYCSWRCRNKGNRLVKPELYRFIKNNGNARRRSLVKKISGTTKLLGKKFSLEDWEQMKAECNYTCLSCGKSEPEIKLTIDHKIPLSKGGKHTKENIQPLCYSCNSGKRDRLNFISG